MYAGGRPRLEPVAECNDTATAHYLIPFVRLPRSALASCVALPPALLQAFARNDQAS